MKGISLAVTAIILMVLGAAVLLAYIYFINMGKGQVDIIQYQSALRSCCTDRARYDCTGEQQTSTIKCRVPWGNGEEFMSDLMKMAGVERGELAGFCFCGVVDNE